MNNPDQSPELRKANFRMAILLGCVALTSLVMAGIGVSRMLTV